MITPADVNPYLRRGHYSTDARGKLRANAGHCMRRVLIITYYWPPAGGGGVQRWVKFVKYLPEYGWTPVVYAPLNAEYPLTDTSLAGEVPPATEVLRRPIFEPRNIYRRLVHRPGRKQKPSTELDSILRRDSRSLRWHERLARFLRANLFVPDARSPWIRPSFRYLLDYVRANPVDGIITTGPPHSCHLIGLKLKEVTGIPWIADFRDPWLDVEYFPSLPLLPARLRKHRQLQERVLKCADHVVTVSWSWAELFKHYGAQDVSVVTNGYDADDLMGMTVTRRDEKFIFTSAGTIEEDRNPADLWAALSALIGEQPSLKDRLEVHLAGRIDESVLTSIADPNVSRLVRNHGYLQHREALQMMVNADVLLLIMNKTHSAYAQGLIPGKIFEYIATGKPVIAIHDQGGDTSMIIRGLPGGFVVPAGDVEKLCDVLRTAIFAPESGRVNETRDLTIARYERRRLTATMAGIMDEIFMRSKD